MRTIILSIAVLGCVGYGVKEALSDVNIHEIPIEAEHMDVIKGWVVEGGSYFNGQPNLWSGARLTSDASDEEAIAEKIICIPATGTYLLWAHYESAYGFGSVFTVEIEQSGEVQSATFGRKDDFKYFPFGIGWAVQGPWYYHNTDYVYQCAEFHLRKGEAIVRLVKRENEQPAAMRVVDFLFLTTDPSRDPGDNWAWRGNRKPRIISKFKKPLYLKVEHIGGDRPVLPMISPRLWLIGYYKGPMDEYYILSDRLVRKDQGEPEKGRWLKPGESSGWLKINLYTACPGWLILTKPEGTELRVSVSYSPDGSESETFKWVGKRLDLICSVDKPRYERELLGGRKVTSLKELAERKTRIIRNYEVPGRKARRIFLRTAIGGPGGEITSMAKLASAMGINAASYGIPPQIYARNAPDIGFNTSRGFLTVQNCFINRACLEGDFRELERRLRELHNSYVRKGLGDIPVTFKLIEESGPPALTELRGWSKMSVMFRDYLREEGVRPEEVLSRDDLARIAAGGRGVTEEKLWEMVSLGTGSYRESIENPALYYHSHRFRALMIARAAARTTRLLESIWGEGTYTDSGSIYPPAGDHPVMERGIEPFTLFRERGVTWYRSEMSWGFGGLPSFLGPQTASYEAALARALTKYHNCPLGTYLICDPNRGYTGDFIERYALGLLAQGFRDLEVYTLSYPAECSYIASSDIHRGIKRISYIAGAIEDRLLSSKVIGAEIAVGWSMTSDIWDLAVPEHDPKLLSNNIYPQERYLLYLLLRHAQFPVDILGERDLTDGYLGRYKVYFLIGDHLRPEAAETLRRWVENGGTLIAPAGGGLRDHYDRPLKTMMELFGIEGTHLEKRQNCMRPKLELLHARPLDRIRFDFNGCKGEMDVYAYRQSFKLAGRTEVIGRFLDGTPAIIINEYGKGRAILIGALPGLAYVKPAIPMLPYGRGGTGELSGFTPTEFDGRIRELIATLIGLAGVNPPVITSHPSVEAILLEDSDKRRPYIAIVNYDPNPIEGLKVKLNLEGRWNLARVDFARGVRERITPEGTELLFEEPFHKFCFLELR